jgi:hypothetical protein
VSFRLLCSYLAFSSLALAQEPPGTPSVIFLADGEPAEYRASAYSIPDDWFEPDADPGWDSAPAGFGPKARYAEVSTVLSFSVVHLRQRFVAAVAPESLTLSVKHDAAPLDGYLNGEVVLSMDGIELPEPDARGFRHYDLTEHIGKLADNNVLALRVEGVIAVPVLHGTTTNLAELNLAVDPTATRLVEGGASGWFRVFSGEGISAIVELRGIGGSGATFPDFEIRRGGIPVEIRDPAGFPYFNATFDGSGNSSVYEIVVTDDSHAEAAETIEIAPRFGGGSVPFVISRNDLLVTRTVGSGEGTLGQAVENAESMPGLETIRFSDDEGVPFSLAPVTVYFNSGPALNLREGFTVEGPPPPGRVTIQGDGGAMFYISGAAGAAASQDLTFRRLVFTGASRAVKSMRYSGSMLMEDCEFVGNEIALDLYGRESAPVVQRCTFSENVECVESRSGLPAEIRNCTFFANSGTVVSGPSLEHCTIVGEGRLVYAGGWLKNCLLVGEDATISIRNRDFDQGGNLFAISSPLGYRLNPLSLETSPDLVRLGEPGFHGGFTRTIPILRDSPALDLGVAPGPESPEFDQRGEPFQRKAGLAPDAGAFEVQLEAADIVIGLETEPGFDPLAGVYFQFAVFHNTSPWTLSGFRLQVAGLPSDAFLYNASGDNLVDIAGPIQPGAYRVVMLQYCASRPDLSLMPDLSVSLLPHSDQPEPPSLEVVGLVFVGGGESGRRLEFPTEPSHDYRIEVSGDLQTWAKSGPLLCAESASVIWEDPDPVPPRHRYYRVVRLE